VPVLLAIPALIPLAQSIIGAWRRGEVATGFIIYDMPCYMANAREHFDQGFQLFYGNPYAGYDTPAIYFQPHIFLLGCLQQLGLDPGLTFNIFGIAALLFTAFVAVHFYHEVVGWYSPGAKLALVCFFWGGGILSLSGLVYSCIVGKLNTSTVLHFDAGSGYWMLNFGRNLVHPNEAYYHGVFLLSMLFLILRRFGIAIWLAALLSISHPFAGLEATLIVAAFLALENVLGDKSVKPVHLVSSAALVVFHLGYYVFFLNRFADHRALVMQWVETNWAYRLSTFLPALFIVAVLAVTCLSRWPGWRQLWREPRNRLFLVWFLMVFGLTQHDLVMKPLQPIHFAHGYDWMALFFLSATLLVAVLDRLLRLESPRLRMLAVSAFMLFFLSDNIVWFASFFKPNTPALYLTKSQKEVLDWLGARAVPRDMVVSSDWTVSYLVSTYTRVRSWEGHELNTPFFDERERETSEAFHSGTILPAWKTMHVFYVASHDQSGWKPPSNSREVFHNAQFDIWECPPTRRPAGTLPGLRN
jgi:uncharacterized membrane protein YvlD (DUF360 family)